MCIYTHETVYTCISATVPRACEQTKWSVPGSCERSEPCTLVLGVLRTLKGPEEGYHGVTWGGPGLPAPPFFDHFFDIVLGPQFSRFWCQLGSNLPPNLAPKSTQIRAKRGPNTKPTCIIFSIPFLIDFGSLLDRILVGFGCQVEGQVGQKIDHMASCWQDGRHSKKH